MARRAQNVPLAVALNGRRVGLLRRAPSGAIDFAYATEWLAWEEAFAISLSLPLREEIYVGAPVTAAFDNLLPDNSDIRLKVAQRVGAEGQDVYSLLSAIGRDCVGALQFLPEDGELTAPGGVDGEPISEAQIADLLANLASAPLGLNAEVDFRISLAGAQEKTALLRVDGRWLRPHGATPTTHILKPQIGHLANGVDLSCSVENEYLCMELTRALGLPVANVEMASFAGRSALVVERFDRLWTRDQRLLRLPQEDMCQALGYPSSRKYEAEGGPGAQPILRLLAGGDEPMADRRAFVRALAVFWLLGATDGHAKNFSLHLEPRGRYRLAPLYDILSVQPAVAAHQVPLKQFKLSMAMGKSRNYAMSDVAPRHIVETGALGGLRDRFVLEDLQALVEISRQAVDAVLSRLPADFPASVAEPVVEGLRTRMAVLERYLLATASVG